MFDPKLTFSLHYDAPQELRSSSCKDFKDISTFTFLFSAFERSKLEYGSVVWAPSADVHIEIEKIQRRFLKFLVLQTKKKSLAIFFEKTH